MDQKTHDAAAERRETHAARVARHEELWRAQGYAGVQS